MNRLHFGFKLFLLALLGSSIAFGAAASGPWSGIDALQRWMKAGFYVGAAATAVNTNKVTRMLAGAETVDFASATITCADSTGSTVTGALAGDGCEVGLPAAPGNASFTCYVSAADTVKVHFCPAGTAVDPASGSYRVYLRSNQ